MSAAARYPSVSLGCHTGDERRRLVPPLRTADVLPSDAPSLPLQTHGAPGADRMQQSAPILRAVAA